MVTSHESENVGPVVPKISRSVYFLAHCALDTLVSSAHSREADTHPSQLEKVKKSPSLFASYVDAFEHGENGGESTSSLKFSERLSWVFVLLSPEPLTAQRTRPRWSR
jgi:hypothetical protein